MRILFLDIETAPNIAAVWGVRKQYLSAKNLLDTSYVLCYAASWAGSDYTLFDSTAQSEEGDMLRGVHALLEEADVVVTYNGNSFDIPTLNREFLKQGLPPPAPYKSVDVYQTVRRRFRFTSAKMDDVLRELGFEGKSEHRGLALWIQCMQGNKEAWREMETYNVQDVTELENLYYRVLPWINNHPNHSVHSGELCCPNCSSKKYQSRGTVTLTTGVYNRFQCSNKGCGKWFRGSTAVERRKEKMISVQS